MTKNKNSIKNYLHFRFLHLLVRVHSESIAFQQASLVEHGKVEDALDKLVDVQHSLYLRQYFLSFSTNIIDYFGSIFSFLMLGIPIFSGTYDHLSATELSVLISAVSPKLYINFLKTILHSSS